MNYNDFIKFIITKVTLMKQKYLKCTEHIFWQYIQKFENILMFNYVSFVYNQYLGRGC